MRQLAWMIVLLSGGCVLYTPGCEHAEEPADLAVAPPPDLYRGIGAPCDPQRLGCVEGTCCDGTCVDTRRDPAHCGACGIACPSGTCVATDLGGSFCACDTDRDGGAVGCGAPSEPTCSDGLCVCGGTYQVCAPAFASGCSAEGLCTCGNEPACTTLSDHCDPSQTPSCRCGDEPACDETLADHCNPRQSPACGCGSGPPCQKGASSCCTFSHTCCTDAQNCCLDGCCDHPCLFFGFCDH